MKTYKQSGFNEFLSRPYDEIPGIDSLGFDGENEGVGSQSMTGGVFYNQMILKEGNLPRAIIGKK